MDIAEFAILLERRLQQTLPGRSAQLKMSSLARIREWIKLSPPNDAVQSSVLILLYPFGGQTRLVLMLRPEYRGVHSGQISLPGGNMKTPTTALYTLPCVKQGRRSGSILLLFRSSGN